MAAITPHLGEEQPLDPVDAAYQNCAAGDAAIQGLGVVGETCPTPGEVVGALHAGLVDLAYMRHRVQAALAQQTFGVARGPDGFQVTLTPGVDPETVPWRPMNRTTITKVELLTWTSKMGAPSFSIPAGHPEIGGTCPGAAAGQSVVSEGARGSQARVVLKVLNEHAPPDAAPITELDLAAAVCEHCYATDGNYAYADNIALQAVRAVWASWALGQATSSPYGLNGGPSNLFIDTMVEAINHASFDGPDRGCEPAQWAASGWRFFRIHDSGDFGVVGSGVGAKDYFLAWKAVTNAFVPQNPHGFKPVMFWAPTRMWAVPGWIEFIDEVNRGAPNFVIRASGYELNQHVPDLRRGDPQSGWAAGATVFAPEAVAAVLEGRAPTRFDWNCQAYAVKEGPTCRGAMSPPLAGYGNANLIGCRACWMLPDTTINYTAH